MSGYAAMLAILGVLMAFRSSSKRDPKAEAYRDLMRAMIRVEARQQGVPELLALATARVESGFDHKAEGDRSWPNNRARYDRVISRESPYYDRPELWHSYGLFQLLAPYHTPIGQDPRDLLDPPTNIQRGVAKLKDLLSRHPDWNDVRLAYKGIRRDNPKAAEVIRRFQVAIKEEASRGQAKRPSS